MLFDTISYTKYKSSWHTILNKIGGILVCLELATTKSNKYKTYWKKIVELDISIWVAKSKQSSTKQSWKKIVRILDSQI